MTDIMIDRWGLLLHGSLWCPGAEFKSIIAVAASMSDSVKDIKTQRSEHCSVSECVCLWGEIKGLEFLCFHATLQNVWIIHYHPDRGESEHNCRHTQGDGERERKRLIRTNNENSPAYMRTTNKNHRVLILCDQWVSIVLKDEKWV